jgi:hypothetical protein
MTKEADQVRALAHEFRKVVSAARALIANRRIEGFRYDSPSDAKRANAWCMLVRALNLADSSIQAACSGYGETVALVARCLEEMAFIVKILGPQLNGTAGFMLAGLESQKRTLQCFIEGSTGDRDRSGSPEALRRIMALIGNSPVEWAAKVRERANQADMLGDYETSYRFLSEQAHTENHALIYYQVKAHDVLEVHQKIWPMAIAFYVLVAADFFRRLMELLMPALGIASPEQYRKAKEDFECYVRSLDTGNWMRWPYTVDWD